MIARKNLLRNIGKALTQPRYATTTAFKRLRSTASYHLSTVIAARRKRYHSS